MKSFSASNLLNYFSYDDDLLRRIMLLILLLIPIFILIGRSPLDIAASTIAVSFLLHSIYWKDFRWLRAKWVQATLLFWIFIVLNSLLHMMLIKLFPELPLLFGFPFLRLLFLIGFCDLKKI